MNNEFNAKIIMGNTGRRVAWDGSYSPDGYRLSEVISAMGKEIRRGNDELAAFWAYQMMISGAEAEDFLWERLRIIALEDVGLANPNALLVVCEAKRLYYDLPSKNFDRMAVGSHATIYLARCRKTRYSWELFEDMRERARSGTEVLPKIPDCALDKHLPRIRETMGRDALHYLTEAAHLENEDDSFTTMYRERLIERAKQVSSQKRYEYNFDPELLGYPVYAEYGISQRVERSDTLNLRWLRLAIFAVDHHKDIVIKDRFGPNNVPYRT